ncbi:TPA: hypothetical protein ACKOG3_002311 [Clostridioides difficile]|nr:hypothetical protein [Clostridioides difficile]HBF4909757.1 hypothetical protein [Clostridioides difficile]HBF6977150.1 hypothetical protein [Clostridioides difficile]HBG8448818.1 hypothetical protein [Clostridioides difficile]
MVFKSLDELVAYTKNKIAASMPEVGKEMKEIVKEEVNKQVYSDYAPSLYDRTYELLNAIDVSEITSDSVATEIKDSGSWFDIYSKAHAFPMERFENGGVWGHGSTKYNPVFRPRTNIMEESNSKAQERVPKCFKSTMNRLGVPIE